eukprot:COSAG05_NODE_3709_length_1889_cov_55.505030_2_plen_57_part_00
MAGGGAYKPMMGQGGMGGGLGGGLGGGMGGRGMAGGGSLLQGGVYKPMSKLPPKAT